MFKKNSLGKIIAYISVNKYLSGQAKLHMALSDNDIQKALRIKRAVIEYFENSTETKVQAKELMNLFISKKIFTTNHKDGLPIRDFLRLLDQNEQLNLIPQVLFEQKNQNKNWYFIKTNY